MPDHTLHGNHDACPACAMRREEIDTRAIDRESVPCNMCGGDGFIPLPPAEIVRRTVEHARVHYWPAVEARWRKST
ncbi:hypothetical protein QCN27_03750 [Cereibacter sp. SYSU M97828]|nr:hypothetical protein [Cereibacter flavus]